MARAKRIRTPREAIYRRDITSGRVYDITYRIGGKKVWESGFRTQAAAQERLAERRASALLGGPPLVRPRKLEPFIQEIWLPRQEARVKQDRLRSSALKQYKADLRLHVVPVFGGWRLDRIDLGAAQRFHDALCDSQANWSVLRIVNTLSGVLGLAQKLGHIRYNPVRDVEKVPARSKRQPVILTIEQFWTLIETAVKNGIAGIVMLAGIHGLRQSEIFGLRWPSLNLTEGAEVLIVTEQYYRREIVDRTKTPAGMRMIPLITPVAEELRAHYLRLTMEGRPNPHDLVFPNSRGNHLHASNFTAGPWKKVREVTGLEDLDFQDLRDFYVSHLRTQELPTAVTMQLTGHTNERVHASYTHPIPGTEDQIRKALTRAFERPSGSTVVAPETSEG